MQRFQITTALVASAIKRADGQMCIRVYITSVYIAHAEYAASYDSVYMGRLIVAIDLV